MLGAMNLTLNIFIIYTKFKSTNKVYHGYICKYKI